jgi:AmmeMemoRadiSam system protein B
VAGFFYPDSPSQLKETVDDLLARAEGRAIPFDRPKAMIVPHAGYIYSGPIAASAYVKLQPLKESIRTVVLLGPAHRYPVEGLALPHCDCFETPLGRVNVAARAAERIRDLPQVVESAEAHGPEHSLEVQLPFLQRVLGEFEILPLVVGEALPSDVQEVIDALWGGLETLILISSDLSHYLPYPQARSADEVTAGRILDLAEPFKKLTHDQACGATPINGLLLSARGREMHTRLLDLRNSGDTAGEKDRVVGYGAFGFAERQ